jgi:hypothetical protein
MPKSFSLRSAQTVAVLAVTQLIGWGTSFDMLGVMGRVIAPDLGLPNEVVFGGLTLMMIVSALAGPVTGAGSGDTAPRAFFRPHRSASSCSTASAPAS